MREQGTRTTVVGTWGTITIGKRRGLLAVTKTDPFATVLTNLETKSSTALPRRPVKEQISGAEMDTLI